MEKEMNIEIIEFYPIAWDKRERYVIRHAKDTSARYRDPYSWNLRNEEKEVLVFSAVWKKCQASCPSCGSE